MPFSQTPRALLKFWLVEFWGPAWDGHRRSMLLRHYWSYLRHPPTPAEFFPESLHAAGSSREREFSRAYRERIAAVQSAATQVQEVHLTFRPIGKNLRLIGTAVRLGADRGRRVSIRAGGPPDEIRMLASRGHEWTPWLWARGPAGTDAPMHAARAWNQLFVWPDAGAPVPSSDGAGTRPLPKLVTGHGTFSRRHLEAVLKVAAATRHVCTPRPEVMARIDALKRAASWPSDGTPVLGIHVRRGDAVAADPEPGTSTRPAFALGRYLEAADRMCSRYGIRHIFLATESREEVERATALRPQYRFLWFDYDRSILPDIRTSSRFIEDRALEHPEQAREVAITGIFDLCGLADCHAFIGTFNSEFSVLGWLLAVGTRGHLVPHLSLSQPAPSRQLHPFAALLNRQNNCPLELHHW